MVKEHQPTTVNWVANGTKAREGEGRQHIETNIETLKHRNITHQTPTYVKTQIRKTTGNDFSTSVVSVLPHFTHQHPWPSSFFLKKRLHFLHRVLKFSFVFRTSVLTRVRPRHHVRPWHMVPPDVFQRVGNFSCGKRKTTLNRRNKCQQCRQKVPSKQ